MRAKDSSMYLPSRVHAYTANLQNRTWWKLCLPIYYSPSRQTDCM